MKVLAFLAGSMALVILATSVYIGPIFGYPLAAFWSLAFFLLTAMLVYLLRDFFATHFPPVNFLNHRYYRSFSVLAAIFIILPSLVFLLKISFDHADGTKADMYRKAATVFVGRVYGMSNRHFAMVKFEVIQKIKGDDGGMEIAETGLLAPSGCFFRVNVGDIFMVYLQKDIMGGYILTCNGMKKLDSREAQQYSE